ncbi:MAG: MYXO-CTERM sorting domain-containing protein [Myxococcota bacterium]|nr:MYXO-CTERM sorting domain-containing protein [Myxococcota bacterium]
MTLLLGALALAQTPADLPPTDLPATDLSACGPVEHHLDTLKARQGIKEAYDCVAASDAALDPLLQAIEIDPENNTLTRGLTVWRLQRLDSAIGGAESRAYQAADRRLLMDGIKAHRGRKSASAQHEVVFAQMGWYSPQPTYTDGRLQQVDKDNLQILREPPAPPQPELEALPAAETAEAESKGCGCSSTPSAGGLFGLLGVLGLLAWRRRGARSQALPASATQSA